ncbi:MAG TPA: 30S ribosomal protein S27ae [Candidatus Acidoferrales bacterium]|nr:30S ribosomal protein S27ae [Candidatus Acidoferrales bacterium]
MSEKPQVAEKKGPKARVGTLYDLDQQKGTIKLKNRKCPRCGNIMAYHKNPVERWTCGSCSFTDFVKAPK